MALERNYQSKLIKKIKNDWVPGCYVLKNDPTYLQGVPDLIVIYGSRWAMLEVKKSATEPKAPNQEYYVQFFDDQGYARFIYPENESEVLEGLEAWLLDGEYIS